MLASVVLALALFSTAYSAPQAPYVVPTLSRTEVRDSHNQFSLSYVTGDGTAISRHGELKQTPTGNVLIQQGTVAYTAPNGEPVSLSYVADENGYRAEGSHVPRAPAPVGIAVPVL